MPEIVVAHVKCDQCGVYIEPDEEVRPWMFKELAEMGVENHFCSDCVKGVSPALPTIVRLLKRVISQFRS